MWVGNGMHTGLAGWSDASQRYHYITRTAAVEAEAAAAAAGWMDGWVLLLACRQAGLAGSMCQ
jgi:hypothetical protein